MKLSKVIEIGWMTLFPTIREYFNFTFMWIFFIVSLYNKEPTIVLISGLGVLYTINEWLKGMKVNHKVER